MVYRHETTRRHESKLFEGVVFYLNKMTEGRRLSLKSAIAEPTKRLRELLHEQEDIIKQDESVQDLNKYSELQEQIDEIIYATINPEWLKWGLKKIEGFESDGKPLDVQDWADWPSALFNEALEKIKSESELGGLERKNSELPTTSGELGAPSPIPSTAPSANEKVIGEAPAEPADGIALATSPTT